MTDVKGDILLKIARGAISRELGLGEIPTFADSWLSTPAAIFVTLTKKEELRGCIGSLEPRRALRDDLCENAVAAAFRDPRFSPLTREELPFVRIEVSLLSAVEPVHFKNEADALAQLRPGTDGVVFEYQMHRSTFLPQVWEKVAGREEFMAHLKMKAGLSGNFWAPQVRLSRYTLRKWREESRS